MKITYKILLATLPFLILLGLTTLYLNISGLTRQGDESLENIHQTMTKDKQDQLQDLVRTTYEIIKNQYEAAHDNESVAETYKNQLESVVNLAYSSIESVFKDTSLSEYEKKEKAKQIINGMRYDGGNYLWINDMKPTMVMHPIKPALNGKDLSEFKDPNGKALFVAMRDVCKVNGQGFVDYMWPKPGADDPVAKLSYVKLFEPWGWVIGTGVYLQAAEERFKEEARRQVSALRFGQDNKEYFFIISSDNKMVMHPIKPKLNGSDLTDFRDTNGKKLFSAMVEKAKKEGSGFVEYYWERAGEDVPVPKLSFIKLFEEWGWIVGTGVYTDDIEKQVNIQREKIDDMVSTQISFVLSITIGLTLVVAVLVVYLSVRISSPIVKMNEMLRDIAEGEGDLRVRLEVMTKDELGEMAKWTNIFIEKLQGMLGYISQESKQINNQSENLSSISADLAGGAQDTAQKSESVAAAVGQMSDNMSLVAASMDETSENVNVVASAVEEMTSTINEIAQTSEKARTITDMAVGRAATASKSVDDLGVAADEITKVLETIAEISEQVDLLALNATIEAARAGEAGKGFAVVASEIKDLANQTAEATDLIKEKIDSIQATTTTTVKEIESISSVVGENSEIVNTIATAVEEQSVTANEISSNVAQITTGIVDVNRSVAESSKTASEIADDIKEVNGASATINQGAHDVDENSQQLRNLSVSLEKLVNTYKF